MSTTTQRLVALAGIGAVALTGCGSKSTSSSTSASSATSTSTASATPGSSAGDQASATPAAGASAKDKQYTAASLAAVLAGEKVAGRTLTTASEAEVKQAMAQNGQMATALKSGTSTPPECRTLTLENFDSTKTDKAQAIAIDDSMKVILIARSRTDAADAKTVADRWTQSNEKCNGATLNLKANGKAVAVKMKGTVLKDAGTTAQNTSAADVTTSGAGGSSKQTLAVGTVGNVVLQATSQDGSVPARTLEQVVDQAAALYAADLQT